MKFKPFNKNITITPHVIDQQLQSWRDMMARRDAAHAQPWADTVPTDETEERLATLDDKRKGDTNDYQN